MLIRKRVVALIALLALAIPAQADLVLLFLDSPFQPPQTGTGTFPNIINNFIPLGNQPFVHDNFVDPPVSVPAVSALNNPFAPPGPDQAGSITLQAGQKRIIQVALLDSLIGNTYPPLNPNGPPASSIPAVAPYTNPRWINTVVGTMAPQTFGLTLWETRITGTVIGPTNNPTGGAFVAPPNPVGGIDPDYGNGRLALTYPGAQFINTTGPYPPSMPPLFSYFGGLVVAGNGGWPNRDFGADAPRPQLGGRFSLFNFEITTVESDPGGTYPITLSDGNLFLPFINDFEVRSTGAGGIGTPGDRIGLDPVIFSAAHPTYTLNVTVTPVPEPTSLALAGIALVGLGCKLRRRVRTKPGDCRALKASIPK